MDLKTYIRDVPDFPQKGILFRDIMPLLQQPAAYREAVRQLAAAPAARVTHVAAIEARGFLFAPAIAAELNVGLIPIRKAGKLPGPAYTARYALEYGESTLSIHEDALDAGAQVYLIDDLIATGGSLAAGVKLIQNCGAAVSHIGCLIELSALNGKAQIADTPFTALIKY